MMKQMGKLMPHMQQQMQQQMLGGGAPGDFGRLIG